MLRKNRLRGTVLGGFASTAFFAASAMACSNDGMTGPCHCAARAAMFNVPVPAAVTTLTGATTFSGTSASSSGDYLPMSFGSGNTPASTTTVHVFNFDFSTNPSSGMIMDAVIHVGDTVHWQWDSGFHTVTSVAGASDTFDSGALAAPSGTFDHTFNTEGVVQYFCGIHGFDNGDGTAGGMSGTITILPVPEPTTALLVLLPVIPMLSRRAKRR